MREEKRSGKTENLTVRGDDIRGGDRGFLKTIDVVQRRSKRL